eukprot:341380-Pelagomonas_calceolata.AAC.5
MKHHYRKRQIGILPPSYSYCEDCTNARPTLAVTDSTINKSKFLAHKCTLHFCWYRAHLVTHGSHGRSQLPVRAHSTPSFKLVLQLCIVRPRPAPPLLTFTACRPHCGSLRRPRPRGIISAAVTAAAEFVPEPKTSRGGVTLWETGGQVCFVLQAWRLCAGGSKLESTRPGDP